MQLEASTIGLSNNVPSFGATLHKKVNFLAVFLPYLLKYWNERNQNKSIPRKRDDESTSICRISISLVVWLLRAFENRCVKLPRVGLLYTPMYFLWETRKNNKVAP